jgi:hypothetical protein
LKQGIVLFSSAQQLQQQKVSAVAGAAGSSTQPSSSSPGSSLESSGGLQRQASPVVGEITVINGQVEPSCTSTDYAAINVALQKKFCNL